MASLPVRDPVGDHLLTPRNAAMVLDYQPFQFAGVQSIDRDLLLENIVSTVKIAKLFGVPIVHSTINVATGRGQPTAPSSPSCSRTTLPSTVQAPTRGKTPTSSPRCAPPPDAS